MHNYYLQQYWIAHVHHIEVSVGIFHLRSKLAALPILPTGYFPTVLDKLMFTTLKYPWVFRLFTVPYFFVRSFRYAASYRHGYLDFQMYPDTHT